jgi:hypothetical protein
MAYMHIRNLHSFKEMLMFREVYALEKIHGTSANIRIDPLGKKIQYFTGDILSQFVTLFNEEELLDKVVGTMPITIYGEHHGGKILKQSARYGTQKRFVAFEVMIDKTWLNVPQAFSVAEDLGIPFVSHSLVPCTIEALDEQRDLPSFQAIRNGVQEPQTREGIVIRPIQEAVSQDGFRYIAKYKRPEFSETSTFRVVNDPSPEIMTARGLAEEWVTRNRLISVVQHGGFTGIEQMREVILAMVGDVLRESEGEVADTKENIKAIGQLTALLYKKYLQEQTWEN